MHHPAQFQRAYKELKQNHKKKNVNVFAKSTYASFTSLEHTPKSQKVLCAWSFSLMLVITANLEPGRIGILRGNTYEFDVYEVDVTLKGRESHRL